jgi:2-polyprenyl-6-methoxyphenol hydroxylase-like FAD-dependent oxidoreductase
LVDVGHQTYWFATGNTPEGEPEDAAERKSALMARFAGWHDPVGAVLEATPDEAILRNDVYYLDPLRRWSRGRIVLLGDAAHASTPGIGQGAAQALEDAVALADALDRAGEIEDALARYESIRRPRAELTQRLSRRADRAAQIANPVACRLRNAVASHVPPDLQRRQLAPLVLAPSLRD